MKKTETYTQQEIESKLNAIQSKISKLTNQRKEIGNLIREQRAQMKYWETLDIGQYKLYED